MSNRRCNRRVDAIRAAYAAAAAIYPSDDVEPLAFNAAHELMRDLLAEIDLLADHAREIEADRDALVREIHRLRSGETIEGDGLCSHEIAADERVAAERKRIVAKLIATHREEERLSREAHTAALRRMHWDRGSALCMFVDELEAEGAGGGG